MDRRIEEALDELVNKTIQLWAIFLVFWILVTIPVQSTSGLIQSLLLGLIIIITFLCLIFIFWSILLNWYLSKIKWFFTKTSWEISHLLEWKNNIDSIDTILVIMYNIEKYYNDYLYEKDI